MDGNFGDVVSGHVYPRLQLLGPAVRGDVTVHLIHLNERQKRWWPQ